MNSLADALAIGSDRIIVDMRGFLNHHAHKAYTTTRVLQYTSDEIYLRAQLRYTLVDIGLINLSPDLEDRWLRQIHLPRFMVMSLNQFTKLNQLTSERFVDTLTN